MELGQPQPAIERNHVPDQIQIAQGAGVDTAVHGYSGAINTSFPTPMRIPKAVALYKEALPFAFNDLTIGNDLSNRTSVVSASTSWTIWYDSVTDKNRRSSAADGLLWSPDQQRDCLTVLANHTVDRVLFSKDMTATGVVFGSKSAAKGKMSRAYAEKGVVLSAGTFGSAPILERSGVGNAVALKAAGVKQLLDLPGVGANLNDQPGTSTSALIAEAFRNDTSLIDGRNLFGPEISLVNIDEIWGTSASTYSNELISPNTLRSRAQALVDAGAAANIDGAEAILNTTISLIVRSRRKSSPHRPHVANDTRPLSYLTHTSTSSRSRSRVISKCSLCHFLAPHAALTRPRPH
ncbi:hypothetical protein TWF696_004706 [Orbilia brochopaga]|uniref:Glucose-methanol-choline oxidoreductase N-terminal domain-containing protein n=1 Tax=Orbilia brochopaga TaxID=3140254 RepID=A0AAV9U032_9PEZI